MPLAYVSQTGFKNVHLSAIWAAARRWTLEECSMDNVVRWSRRMPRAA